MINEGPRSDDARPINRYRTHNERQVVENFMKVLRSEFPIRDLTDVERLVRQLKGEVSHVNKSLGSIFTAHRDTGKILDKDLFKETSQKMYLELLNKYSKDELHILMTCVLADLSVKEWV